MKKLLTLAIAIFPAVVFAHGGHSHFDPTTLIHYLGTPEHALPIASIALIAGWFWFRRYRKVESR